MKTQSNFKDTFIEIAFKHVNREAYPQLSEEALVSLRELFYIHLENCILVSILKYADEDVITVYKAWQKMQSKSAENGLGAGLGLGEGANLGAGDLSFNYASFDTLVDLMVGDNELQAKVDAEVENFAQEFAKYAHGYMDSGE